MTPAELRAAAERLREGLFPEQGAWRTSDIEAGADAFERLADVIEYAERVHDPGLSGQYRHGMDHVANDVLRIARGDGGE